MSAPAEKMREPPHRTMASTLASESAAARASRSRMRIDRSRLLTGARSIVRTETPPLVSSWMLIAPVDASNDRGAAIDHECLTRDVAACVGGEQQSRTHEIAIAANFPQRRLPQDFGAVLLE